MEEGGGPIGFTARHSTQSANGDGERLERDRSSRLMRLIRASAAVAVMLCGCQLVPNQPEAVFVLYRDRMKTQNLDEARSLLSNDSRRLALELAAEHKLQQSPESLALLNALDPAAAPVVMKSDEMSALLQLRTLKGGLRLVRLIRKDPNSPWKIDMSEELRSLQSFLEARGTLDMIREQAGEYAATYKAFSNQLEKMHIAEPPLPKPATLKPTATKPAAPKHARKPKPQAKVNTKTKKQK
ncbi:MAG: hypothetical protein ACLP5H_22735 [Desulfomonilaceae bacterium]